MFFKDTLHTTSLWHLVGEKYYTLQTVLSLCCDVFLTDC